MTNIYVHRLDAILKYLALSPFAKPHLTFEEIFEASKKLPEFTGQDDKGVELRRILKKLFDDGNIEISDAIKHWITYDGVLFALNGGYQVQIKNDNQAKIDVHLTLEEQQVNNRLLMKGSIGAAIAASLLLIWDIVKFGIEHHWFSHSFHHCH